MLDENETQAYRYSLISFSLPCVVTFFFFFNSVREILLKFSHLYLPLAREDYGALHLECAHQACAGQPRDQA